MINLFRDKLIENILLVGNKQDQQNYVNTQRQPTKYKIDENGFVVYPSEAYVIPSVNNLYIIDFVNDMYLDLRKEISLLIPQKKFDTSRSFYASILDVGSTVSYTSTNLKYTEQLNELLDIPYVETIENFKKEYRKTKDLYVTKTNFLLNNKLDYTYTGLCIEFKGMKTFFEVDQTSDKLLYYIDPNFNNYDHVIRKTGFLYDYNYPYRIFVDLSSALVYDKYLSKYDIASQEELFETMYYRSFEVDLESVKNIMSNFINVDNYNEFELLLTVLSIELNINIEKEINKAVKYYNLFGKERLLKVMNYTRQLINQSPNVKFNFTI